MRRRTLRPVGGYVAVERIGRASVHLAWLPAVPAPALAAGDRVDGAPWPDWDGLITDVRGAPFAAGLRARLRDQLEYLGELWTQTTFYLFDGESWHWPDAGSV